MDAGQPILTYPVRNLLLSLGFFLLAGLSLQGAATDKTWLPNPIVPATTLDEMTTVEIRNQYPGGIQVYSSTLSLALKAKLKDLASQGFRVTYLASDDTTLQQLTQEERRPLRGNFLIALNVRLKPIV